VPLAGLLLAGLLLEATALPAAASKPAAAPLAAAGEAAIDRLVADNCGKRLVLLGEERHHGAGATVAAKGEAAERLVERCGFSAILFEGQIYDFLALQRAFDEGGATPRMLSATIGGLWSPTADFQPFEDFLFERARDGRLLVGGVDPQLGGASQRYSQDHLADDLFRRLDEPLRGRCVDRLSTLANWRFDDATPYDRDFRDGIRDCLASVASLDAATGAAGGGEASANDIAASHAVRASLAASLDMADGDAAARDRAMAANVLWYLQRLPRGAKAIVWTASVHAATASLPVAADERRDTMGARLRQALGQGVAAIGFVAASGSYGSHGRGPFPIAPAVPRLLEARQGGPVAGTSYLDREALAAAGRVPSRVLDYAQPQVADWSTLFDGVLVLRGEHPLRTLESPSAPLPAQRQDPR
jgi:erythromycin esterase-like protein